MPQTESSTDKKEAAPQYITKTGLKERGWTDTMIRDFLADPDKYGQNPYYRSGADIQYYALSRIEAAEQSQAWQERSEAARRRRSAAEKATQTKTQRLIDSLEEKEKIDVPIMDKDRLIKFACDSYNDFQMSRGNYEMSASKNSTHAFLERLMVNYLRHELSDYEYELYEVRGKVGKRKAYEFINNKVYEAIIEAYPYLSEECQRQMIMKEVI